MKQKLYEIWEHPGSQTWKVFIDVTQDLRATLLQTGWNPVFQYHETDNQEQKAATKEEPD